MQNTEFKLNGDRLGARLLADRSVERGIPLLIRRASKLKVLTAFNGG